MNILLDENSYTVGMVLYLGAGGLASLFVTWWFRRRWTIALGVSAGLLLAALLLTPAYQSASAETMAPALIVAAFEWLTNGREAADHAIRPLLASLGLASAVSAVLLLLGWIIGRRKPRIPLTTEEDAA